jgi:hypothetical protein
MRYSIWMDGTKIGETEFELRHGRDRRGGIFLPTQLGLSLLPGITAMTPALLDLGRLSRERRADASEALDECAHAESMLATPEGNRMIDAAEQISKLELRDPSGEVITWDSLLISDFRDLSTESDAQRAARRREERAEESDPVRYFISATFAAASRARSPWGRRPGVTS